MPLWTPISATRIDDLIEDLEAQWLHIRGNSEIMASAHNLSGFLRAALRSEESESIDVQPSNDSEPMTFADGWEATELLPYGQMPNTDDFAAMHADIVRQSATTTTWEKLHGRLSSRSGVLSPISLLCFLR